MLCACAALSHVLQPSLLAPGASGSQGPVVMCVTDDEVNHIVLEGILQSQNYRWGGLAAEF